MIDLKLFIISPADHRKKRNTHETNNHVNYARKWDLYENHRRIKSEHNKLKKLFAHHGLYL